MSRKPDDDPLDDDAAADDASLTPLDIDENGGGGSDDVQATNGHAPATPVVDGVEELKNVLAAELSTDTTQHYLNQIGLRPLLTVTEEVHYATLAKQGQFAARQK
jgi:RNA polymerase nonessential primary-like sigma factor